MKQIPRLALLAAASAALAGCMDPLPVDPGCGSITIAPAVGDTITTPTNLRYIVTQTGEGPPIQATETATLHYIGFLADGTLFDTSVGGPPPSFSLQDPRVIPGFVEGVTGMRVEEIRRLIVPPQLAYGNDRVRCIPPNSTIYFDVNLRGITSPGT